MNNADIDPPTQALLKLGGEAALVKTIWSLSSEQKRSPLYHTIGVERYLSALRVGEMDNADMARNAFNLDPFFVQSKLAKIAAMDGYLFKMKLGHGEIALKIKELMKLPDDVEGERAALDEGR